AAAGVDLDLAQRAGRDLVPGPAVLGRVAGRLAEERGDHVRVRDGDHDAARVLRDLGVERLGRARLPVGERLAAVGTRILAGLPARNAPVERDLLALGVGAGLDDEDAERAGQRSHERTTWPTAWSTVRAWNQPGYWAA